MREEVSIAGVRCEIYTVGNDTMDHSTAGDHPGRPGDNMPVFLLGTTERDPDGGQDYIEHMIEEITKRISNAACRIVAYYRQDWNREFSPWQAAPVFGDDPFGGEGEVTLRWLTEECIPYLKERFAAAGDLHFYTAGYSLAALFALWAVYESDCFAGSVRCSGSLWFPGWKEYMAGSRSVLRESSLVYLSLGGKEARTKNTLMATIADATRAQEKSLKADPHVRQTILEWNPGGHFADSAERLAKGMVWIMGREH